MAGESKKIKSAKASGSREEIVYLGIQRAAESLKGGFSDLLKSHDLTLTQYSVLGILRIANIRGASCSQISDALATKDSDITRILERMETAGLIRRERQKEDRRVILAFIAEKGLATLESLDVPALGLYKKQFSSISKKDLDRLAKLLRKIAA